MIDYNLALELNKAGFLQGGKGSYWTFKEKRYGYEEDDWGISDTPQHKENLYIPTLSELILACSKFDPYDKFIWTLERRSGSGWKASNSTKTIRTEGSSPEEAVSRLYLALQKK